MGAWEEIFGTDNSTYFEPPKEELDAIQTLEMKSEKEVVKKVVSPKTETGDKNPQKDKTLSENENKIDEENADQIQAEKEEEIAETVFTPVLSACVRMAFECPYNARMAPLARSQGMLWGEKHPVEVRERKGK